jgi:hypothetical protein
MASGYRSVLWRRAARTGKRKARRSVEWLWPLIAPVGFGIVVACGESWADPQVISPSGLPAQVRPTYPEPGLPAFSFPQGGVIQESGAGSGTGGTQGTSGTPGSPATGEQASTATLANYQQYVGSYYDTGIYLGQDASGVQILDQWSGSGGASIHTIPWSTWGGNTAEAGSHYYTIK